MERIPREFPDSNSYLDESGDVLPYADVADTFDSRPVTNPSVVQGMENLRQSREHEAAITAAEAQARQERVHDANPGVSVTLEQYYQDQLDLLDVVSGSLMRAGFKKGGSRKPEAVERYGHHLPDVEAGSHRNHQKLVNEELPRIYHAQELIDAGFYKEDVIHDAKTTLRSEATSRYGGTANKNKRAARRRELKRRLDSLQSE